MFANLGGLGDLADLAEGFGRGVGIGVFGADLTDGSPQVDPIAVIGAIKDAFVQGILASKAPKGTPYVQPGAYGGMTNGISNVTIAVGAIALLSIGYIIYEKRQR